MIYKVNNKYKYRLKGNTKKVLSDSQTEPDRYNLNHLYNFLQKNVGKEWDYIYSILKQRVPSGLWEFVERTVKLTDIITYDRSVKFQVMNGILLPIDYVGDIKEYSINKHYYYEREGIDESGDSSNLCKPLYKRGSKERVNKNKFTIIDNKSNYLNFIR